MKKTIWKYPLEVETPQELQMPENAEILSVQVQAGIPCLWALVNADNFPRLSVNRTIEIYGTGHVIPAAGERVYIDTFQMHGGSLVLHVFENTNP